MIIKSKLRLFNFWLSIIAFYGGTITLFYFIFFNAEKIPISGLIALYFGLILLILICGGNLYAANKISINTDLKIVSFKKRFSRQVSAYKFSDFDGKLNSYEPIKGETVKNLFLIKNRKAIIKISGIFYSNQMQIESSLEKIPSLGSFNYYSLTTWKIKLGLPVTK